jgi:hypothetical protein
LYRMFCQVIMITTTIIIISIFQRLTFEWYFLAKCQTNLALRNVRKDVIAMLICMHGPGKFGTGTCTLWRGCFSWTMIELFVCANEMLLNYFHWCSGVWVPIVLLSCIYISCIYIIYACRQQV